MNDALHSWFVTRGAVVDGDGPVHFGDPRGEYEAARSGAALIDRSRSGRLFLTGRDALDLLHRTTTGDLKSLEPGRGATTVIQTETARILDRATVFGFTEHLIMVTGPGRGETDAAWIDRMTIMDDVVVRDITAETCLLEVCGPAAASVVTKQVVAAADLTPLEHVSMPMGGDVLTILRTENPVRSFLVLAPIRLAVEIAATLVDREGVVPIGRLAAESLRLERGVPEVGRELTEAVNPLEAGLHTSIGFEKGCYTGQEVIARMVTYKSVRRTLCGFLPESGITAPEPGSAFDVTGDGGRIGRLTSAGRSYGLDRCVALGFVKNEWAPATRGSDGATVIIETPDGPVAARVASLPLLA